jgi:uracil phosphoribosyltransferase
MRVHVADHPLIAHKITLLRDENTDSQTFRALANELVLLLALEATKSLSTEPTSVSKTAGTQLSGRPLLVPILRAGLGLLDGMLTALPTAQVGFLGMARDETTLLPTIYGERLPQDLSGRQCIVLDPMLATGGSLSAAIKLLFDRGAAEVIAVCLLAAPEGVAAVESAFGKHALTLVIGCLDEKLNDVGYIVPGLGDAGDRLYGAL